MNLDDVSIGLRSRNGYEATELGFAVARQFWKPIFGAWFLTVAPVFLIAGTVAVLTANLWAPLLAVWLLKPLYDRIPLFVVSRAIFGEVPGIRRTIRHAYSEWFSESGLFDATVRRLSPFRSFLIPIRTLEGADDQQYKRRKNVLLRQGVKRPSLMLLGVGMAAEQIFVVGVFAFVGLVVPTEMSTGPLFNLDALFQQSGQLPTTFVVLTMLGYFVAVTLVEVFYAAGGFGLYINRRIKLEGWDVELEFKRMARRLRERSAGKAALWLLATLGASIALVGTPRVGLAQVGQGAQPGPASAAPSDGDSAEADETPAGAEASQTSDGSGDATNEPVEGGDPQQTIDEILDNPEFGKKEERWEWVPREREEESEPEVRERSGERPDGSSFAGLLEVLLWALAGGGVAVFAYFIVRRTTARSGSTETPQTPSPSPQLEEADQEPTFELPDELVVRARRQWQQGNHVESLSALYRGTIRGLADHHGIDIAPYMTARECTRKVRKAGGPGRFVARLGRAWTSTAYADRPPGTDDAEALFDEWTRYFGGGAR